MSWRSKCLEWRSKCLEAPRPISAAEALPRLHLAQPRGSGRCHLAHPRLSARCELQRRRPLPRIGWRTCSRRSSAHQESSGGHQANKMANVLERQRLCSSKRIVSSKLPQSALKAHRSSKLPRSFLEAHRRPCPSLVAQSPPYQLSRRQRQRERRAAKVEWRRVGHFSRRIGHRPRRVGQRSSAALQRSYGA